MKGRFSFEDLDVWQRAVDFACYVLNLTDDLESKREHFRLIKQLESAVTSVALNIAEGSGRYSKKQHIQFLYYSRGSLYETLTILKIFENQSWIKETQFSDIKAEAMEISKMINSLIRYLKNS